MNLLQSGIPKEKDYRSLLKSDRFKMMEDFSNLFINKNRYILRSYSKKWVSDPLHQWSRQWEYPFVLNYLEIMFANEKPVKVLDAGSGITFFPYYIKSKNRLANVYCVDYDASLRDIYQGINENSKDVQIDFCAANLMKIPYEDNFFDAVYCISVLEHTNAYEEILVEFNRILRPGGSLIITFDISLDGKHDISVEKAEALLELIKARYTYNEQNLHNIKSVILNDDIFTTLSAQKMNPGLLPWKLPAFLYKIKSFLVNRQFGSWPPPLTVYCSVWTKSCE